MALEPQTKALMDAMNAMAAPKLYEMRVEEARVALEAITLEYRCKPQVVARVDDRQINGPGGDIPLRIYQPVEGGRDLPLLLYYHGGGFALCSIESHDTICRSLCNDAGAIIVSVDYRRSPEHPFPAAPEDCYAALEWVSEQAEFLGGNSNRIALAGDSAGSNLVAAVTLMAKARVGPTIAFQALCCPGLNLNPAYMTPSRRQFGGGEFFLSFKDLHWLTEMYFQQPRDIENPIASPLLATNLSGLPPALIITADHDMLRDDGALFAEKLRDAGVDAEHVEFEGTIHGFIAFAGVLDAGRDAILLIARRVRERLS
ncbi:alpha/beta hydrolase [Hyphococcus sp. DH-69]|uniref:alpha/beta hydrolase n=1 Tax=Hyphococcus formosus TaxID=3143534 RepID=UPI00398BB517